MAAAAEFEAKGYFDDSQTTGQVWSLGGYMGNPYAWEDFEDYWRRALAKHGVAYFHMREMQNPKGVYAKWYPAKEHEAELAAFFSDLAEVIRECHLYPFSCLVRLKDLTRFNAEYGLSLEPYALAAYGCMILVGKDYVGRSVELVFDHVEKVKSKLAKAQEYADTDAYYQPDKIFDKLVTVGLPKELTFREIPALQAADFWAWEYRKNHLRMDEWWSLEDRPQNHGEEQWEHFRQWFEAKYGSFEQGTRKSAQALIRRSDLKCMIWHYRELCDAHKARAGVWS
jgi:hypothetical protein